MARNAPEPRDVYEIPDKTCENISELIKSPKFQHFLRYYNNLRKSQSMSQKMGVKDTKKSKKGNRGIEDIKLQDAWREVSSGDLESNYHLAMDAYNVWKDLELRGKVEPIEHVQKLVHQMVDQAREYHTERILPQEEVLERFQKLGVDIQKTHAEWEKFYASNKDFKTALANEGQISHREKNYKLPMPEVTEGAMQAFEKAFAEERIDTVMVDDARLKNSAIYQAHFGFDLTNEINRALPITPQKVRKTTSPTAILKARPKHVRSLPKVRLVGFKLSPQGREKQNNFKFTDDLNNAPGAGVMEFSTYTNLMAKFAGEGRKLSTFTSWDYFDGGHNVGGATVSTILNNVDENGDVLLAVPANDGTVEKFSNIKPDELVSCAFARPTVQSDLA